jgi:hypothetical protein
MSIGEPVTEWIAATPFNIPSPQPKATLTASGVSDDVLISHVLISSDAFYYG